MLDGWVVRVLCGRDHDEVFGQACEFVAVRIPDLQLRGQMAEQHAFTVVDGEHSLAVFALLARLDLTAEVIARGVATP